VISGRTPFFVLTQTADWAYRSRVRLTKDRPADASQTCYFPAPASGVGALGTPAVTYNRRNAADTTNVVQRKVTNGFTSPGRYVAVTDLGTATKDEFYELLRHEVQHDADKHRGWELSAGVTNAKSPAATTYEKALREYKTEYRAYFRQGNPTTDTEEHGMYRTRRAMNLDWTPRQLRIFETIRQGYPRVAAAATDPAFVAAANQYADPDAEGFNKHNSVRIDDLYKALDAVGPVTTDPAAEGVADVLRAIDALDSTDARYLADRTESPMLWNKIEWHLAGDARRAVVARLRTRVESDPFRRERVEIPPPPPPPPKGMR
jgi:hypothetical protein